MKLLTVPEAAAYLRVKPQTIYYWRTQGRGPRCAVVAGKLLFQETDLIDFVNAAYDGNDRTSVTT